MMFGSAAAVATNAQSCAYSERACGRVLAALPGALASVASMPASMQALTSASTSEPSSTHSTSLVRSIAAKDNSSAMSSASASDSCEPHTTPPSSMKGTKMSVDQHVEQQIARAAAALSRKSTTINKAVARTIEPATPETAPTAEAFKAETAERLRQAYVVERSEISGVLETTKVFIPTSNRRLVQAERGNRRVQPVAGTEQAPLQVSREQEGRAKQPDLARTAAGNPRKLQITFQLPVQENGPSSVMDAPELRPVEIAPTAIQAQPVQMPMGLSEPQYVHQMQMVYPDSQYVHQMPMGLPEPQYVQQMQMVYPDSQYVHQMPMAFLDPHYVQQMPMLHPEAQQLQQLQQRQQVQQLQQRQQMQQMQQMAIHPTNPVQQTLQQTLQQTPQELPQETPQQAVSTVEDIKHMENQLRVADADRMEVAKQNLGNLESSEIATLTGVRPLYIEVDVEVRVAVATAN